MRQSGINAILAYLCTLVCVGALYCIFTDAGFVNESNIISAFVGYVALTAAQRESNRIMARIRVAAEWGFGQIRAVCPLITKVEILKLKKKTVTLLIRNAVLLTNYRNTVEENPTSLYFLVPPPTVEEYIVHMQ